jgi:uncharacterized protein YqjF (DUF2071 family)
MNEKNWIIQQQWDHVLFLSWLIEPHLIQQLVPFELDLIDGKAAISIVPFEMSRIRFRNLPEVPFLSRLLELNLRTYVRHEGKTGIYFLTLDTDSIIGNWVANRFFRLPYRLANLSANMPQEKNDQYLFESAHPQYELKIQATITANQATPTLLNTWISERYHLFLKKGDSIYRGDVYHTPWSLREVKSVQYLGNFEKSFGIPIHRPFDHVVYGNRLQVRFPSFNKIS